MVAWNSRDDDGRFIRLSAAQCCRWRAVDRVQWLWLIFAGKYCCEDAESLGSDLLLVVARIYSCRDCCTTKRQGLGIQTQPIEATLACLPDTSHTTPPLQSTTANTTSKDLDSTTPLDRDPRINIQPPKQPDKKTRPSRNQQKKCQQQPHPRTQSPPPTQPINLNLKPASKKQPPT